MKTRAHQGFLNKNQAHMLEYKQLAQLTNLIIITNIIQKSSARENTSISFELKRKESERAYL